MNTKARTRTSGPRARVKGENFLERAQRAQEIVRAMPVEKRSIEACDRALRDKGIKLSEHSVYGHINRAKKAERQGTAGVNGDVVSLPERFTIIRRAINSSGGFEAFKEALELIEKARGF